MNILICIDDTDNIESKGTGELASILSDLLESKRWGLCGPVSRHQMLVHPDIPYTSHNSSMCFTADIKPNYLQAVTEFSQSFLSRESASGSDPGLSIVRLDQLSDPDALMSFGKDAKTRVLTKEDAYSLAARLDVHLSEHGGTGQGVIGALAGCGLRLTGNDGRLRGHFKVRAEDDRLNVAELISQTGVDVVKSLDGLKLSDDDIVRIGEKVKAVLQDGKSTLLVYADSEAQNRTDYWQTCTKQQLRIY